MARILLLEDDSSFGYILSEYLMMQDYQVTWVKSGEEALDILAQKAFDLAILDIMLPGIDGFEAARLIKKKYSTLPFIFLSAKSLKIDQLKGFKLGAYDYITKPIDEELLVAKIKALLSSQHAASQTPESWTIGDYSFRPDTQLLIYKDQTRNLTTKESELLLMLCKHKDQLLPREKALKEIWGINDEFNRKSMDVFISHLRKYLSQDPNIKIQNVHGKGFVFGY